MLNVDEFLIMNSEEATQPLERDSARARLIV
jgi:hypothetical protein